ncbi:hypothetical protein SEUCBS140593_009439 [Sporothrix eucalyptigena]|uniref:Zn(2)-C6 fungal-type domain-containing protein n=1 Tax=Sporothrix eucalyptigena TaxID=1812306 RepID=A0ABP0CYB5_9PEZI
MPPLAQGPLFAPGFGTVLNPNAARAAADEHQGLVNGVNNFMPQAGRPEYMESSAPQILAAPASGAPAQGIQAGVVFSGFPGRTGVPQQSVAQVPRQGHSFGSQQNSFQGQTQAVSHGQFLQGYPQGAQQVQGYQNQYPALFTEPQANPQMIHFNGQSQQDFAMQPNQVAVQDASLGQFSSARVPQQPWVQPSANHIHNGAVGLLFVNNDNAFTSFDSQNGSGSIAYNPIAAQPGQISSQTLLPSAPVHTFPRQPSEVSMNSHTSFQPFPPFPPASTVPVMQRESSQLSHLSRTSHHSGTSAPPSATVAFPAQSFPATSFMHARPQQMMTMSSSQARTQSHSTQPRTASSQDEEGELLGVGVQTIMQAAMPGQTFVDNVPVSQSSPDIDVVLPDPRYSETAVKKLIRVNSQFTPPRRLYTQFQESQPAQPGHQRSISTSVAAYDDTPSQTPETRSLLQSAVLTTDSIGRDSSSPLSSGSAPPSAKGDTVMRKSVTGVPGHMVHNWDPTASNQNDNSTEGGRTIKRRRSGEVESVVASTSKAVRGGKKRKDEGKSCLHCAVTRKSCTKTTPCDRCAESDNYACVDADCRDHNIFLQCLREDLKKVATRIIEREEDAPISNRQNISIAFDYLADHKVGCKEFYHNLRTLEANDKKCIVVPFYQASMILQVYPLLNVLSSHDHNYDGFTPEFRDELLVWRAVNAAHALNLIKSMMDKNRDDETPKYSKHAKNLVVILATIYEQAEAFEKTLLAKESVPDALRETQRQLCYNLGYRLHHMCGRAFRPERPETVQDGDDYSGDHSSKAKNNLADFVVVTKNSVTIDKRFWDKLNTLWAQGHDDDEQRASARASQGLSTAMATPASFSSMLTPIDTNFVSSLSGGQSFFMTAPVSATLEPPQMQRRRSKTSQNDAKGKKPRKPRERKADNKWVDDRDDADAEVMISARSPIHDDGPDTTFIDLLQDLRLEDDNEIVFCTTVVDNTTGPWTDLGSPNEYFGDIYNADDGGNSTVNAAVNNSNIANNNVASDFGINYDAGNAPAARINETTGAFSSSMDFGDFDFSRVDSGTMDALMRDSLQQVQVQDNETNLAYARTSISSQGADLLQVPSPVERVPSTVPATTSRPATAATASSVGSDRGSAAGSSRVQRSPSRARRGTDAVMKFFGKKKP